MSMTSCSTGWCKKVYYYCFNKQSTTTNNTIGPTQDNDRTEVAGGMGGPNGELGGTGGMEGGASGGVSGLATGLGAQLPNTVPGIEKRN